MLDQRTYAFQISDLQRKMLVFALAQLVPSLRVETTHLLKQDEYVALAEMLIDAQPVSGSGTQAANALLSPPPPQPVAQPSPIELRDRWARNKKGVEVPSPDGCETFDVEIWKIAPPKKVSTGIFVKVTWTAPDGGRGHVDASCWDENLFAPLANRIKQKTRLYVVRNGNYLNIAGVRA